MSSNTNNIIEFHGGGGGGHGGGGGGHGHGGGGGGRHHGGGGGRGHHGHFGHFGGRRGGRYAGWGPGNYTYSNNSSWIDNGGYYYPYYSYNWDDPYDIVDIQETTYPPHDVKENYEKSCNCCNSGSGSGSGGGNYWAMLLSLLIFLALVYLVYTQIA